MGLKDWLKKKNKKKIKYERRHGTALFWMISFLIYTFYFFKSKASKTQSNLKYYYDILNGG